MTTDKTLLVTTRAEWRDWLEQNFNTEKEVWLIYAKKSSGKKRIDRKSVV